MMMPTSSEFIALCRSQIAILTQGLGATFSVVYLMQQLGEENESQLVPIVAYPNSASNWQNEPLQLAPAPGLFSPALQRLLPASARGSGLEEINQRLSPATTSPSESAAVAEAASPVEAADADAADAIVTQRQVVLPLVQENVMLGLLVVGRDDRGWSQAEQSQIEQIANTLLIACVLDQRSQWLESDRQQERQVQSQQTERLDNLLHQFRNSLTALQTFGKLILKRLQPGDRNREAATSLVRETIRLRELAQQLEAATVGSEGAAPLALPAASADRRSTAASAAPPQSLPLLTGSVAEKPLAEAPLTLTPCAVRSVLEPLLASAETIAQDRHLALHTLIPEHLPLVWANAPALREVLNNLIENALKYTPAGGHILVQLSGLASGAAGVSELGEPPNSWLELTISDTGPGIPAQDLPRIFERWFRGVQAKTRIPGTGLGLAIAQSLVEQMHGEIDVQSPAQVWQTLGVKTELGTSFKLRLAIACSDTHTIKHLTT